MSDPPRKPAHELRSQQWFGRHDRDGFIYRSWLKGKGVPHDQFDGRPVIGICNTFSELTPCNSHFRTLAEQVKIGVYEAGGFPLEFPVMSLGETLMRPTAMLYRNLASMDVEESIRANPLDGVALLMGCDKTTPALMMGASSVDLPTIGVSGGPMLSGKWRGQELGSGTGVWQMSEQVRAGTLKLQDFFEAESCMHRSHGHCMTMGTASTMASMVESLGIGLPGNAAYQALQGQGRHLRAARQPRAQRRDHQAERGHARAAGAQGRRAVVFESADDLHKRIDDESLDIDEHCIMVLKNCGPKGYPGMAESDNMPLPPKVLRNGITDMVRISDARMSGTAYGTVVLHTAPEAAAGGPLALVQDGDIVELDVPNRRLHLHVSDEELARRREKWTAPKPPLDSGYWRLYVDNVLQADQGADLGFLRGKRGSFVPRDNH
ncbi:Dehydratase family protein [Variovorax sp. CF079]|uniref:dihydroxy-acid dehydratase domain-containing protein n=1 Tax=Variovorax sp. CF079 TaxID=1882774 RepID=UPI000887A3AA|nr:dihydroxy-acid dehydratase [Variovorax sp. CF079]SDC04638.1 Dehydratase family protein [Variovorax sp. CF079]